MNGLLDLGGVFVVAGLFTMWIAHSRFRRPSAPPLFRDPLDNPFGRREWYTDNGNRLRTIGAVVAFTGGAMGFVHLVQRFLG